MRVKRNIHTSLLVPWHCEQTSILIIKINYSPINEMFLVRKMSTNKNNILKMKYIILIQKSRFLIITSS